MINSIMKKIYLSGLLFFQLAFAVQAQTTAIEDSLARMLLTQKYTELLSWSKYMSDDTLSSHSLFYIGMSAFLLKQDSLARSKFRNAIEKDPFFAPPYYYLSILSEDENNINQAFELAKAALRNDPGNALYLEHLADLYTARGSEDSAAFIYSRVIKEQENPEAELYMKLAQLYAARGASEKALDIYYDCIYHADDEPGFYNDCIYNAGYLEYSLGHYLESVILMETLLERDSTDYFAMELLVRAAMRDGDLSRANIYRKKLYEAHTRGLLPEAMHEKYLLDEYPGEDGEVSIFEYFADDQAEGIKYEILYMLNDSSMRHFFLVKNAFALKHGKTYVLIEKNEDKALIYPEAIFEKRINYEQLQKYLDKAVSGKLKSD